MRLNIEEECFSRLSRLVDLIGIDSKEALGALAFLWHDSQNSLQTEGTFEEIVDWCRITKLPKDEQERWVKALCRSKFLTELDNNRFLVRGNEKQIAAKEKYISRAKKGGEATKKVWENKKTGLEKASSLPPSLAPSTPQSTLEECSIHAQFNSIQYKEDIYSSKGDEVSEAVEGGLKTTDLVKLWNSLANPSLARVIKLTDGRKRAIARALREYPEAEFWQDVIQAVNKSQFLTGQGAVSGNRSKPWRCDLDFIVRGDNAIKILEGKYS